MLFTIEQLVPVEMSCHCRLQTEHPHPLLGTVLCALGFHKLDVFVIPFDR